MVKRYVVTATGLKKDTGKPYCVAAAIIKTNNSEFLSDRDKVYPDEILSVGQVIEVDQSIKPVK